MSTKNSYDMDKKERVRKYGEVFTPQHIANQMCDMLQAESEDCFKISKTFLEPCCGDGVFVLEILRRKFANCKTHTDYSESLKSVWAMDIQDRNVTATIQNVLALCKEHFQPSKADIETINNHVILCDSLKVMRMINELNKKGDS